MFQLATPELLSPSQVSNRSRGRLQNDYLTMHLVSALYTEHRDPHRVGELGYSLLDCCSPGLLSLYSKVSLTQHHVHSWRKLKAHRDRRMQHAPISLGTVYGIVHLAAGRMSKDLRGEVRTARCLIHTLRAS